jgi:hypothetical protein
MIRLVRLAFGAGHPQYGRLNLTQVCLAQALGKKPESHVFCGFWNVPRLQLLASNPEKISQPQEHFPRADHLSNRK